MEPPVSEPRAQTASRRQPQQPSPAGAAGHPPGIPGIPGGKEGGIFRGGTHGKFIQIGLARQGSPGRLKSFDHCGAVWRHKAGKHPGCRSCQDPVGTDIILYSHGDPGQGRYLLAVSYLPVHCPGLFQSFFPGPGNIGRDPVLHGINPVRYSQVQLLGRDLFIY